MKNVNPGSSYVWKVSVLCLFVLGCIAVAGLWPFHVPRNRVTWIQSENGLHFGRHGSAVSAGAFKDRRSPSSTGHSIEILITPQHVPGGGAIVSFDSSPEDPQAPFLLRQYGDGIALHRYVVDEHGNITQPFLKVNDVFGARKSAFVSITSDKDETDFYVNGVLAKTFSDEGIMGRELSGRLVLANSTTDDSWAGSIRGLAVYNRELSPVEVKAHFESWTSGQAKWIAGEPSLVALYLFDEREGSTAHNVVDGATNLTVPANYFTLHPLFLRSTVNQYAHTRNAWKTRNFWIDLGVNVVGFMPVGFVFFAYFSSVKRIGHPAVTVILLGLLMSFTIETLQWYLPNRDSGMTDLFTNTSGTALGVLLYQSAIVRGLWMKILNFGDARNATVTTIASAQNEKMTFSA